MEDYEIRDALRRATTPKLRAELTFATGPVASIEFPYQSEMSRPISIVVTVSNESSQPAFHALVKIGVDTELPLQTANDFYALGITGADQQQYWLGHRFSSPPDLPIFKEIDPSVGHRLMFNIGFPASLLGGERIFYLATSVQTPGQTSTEKWIIHSRGGTLRMYPPGHPLNR